MSHDTAENDYTSWAHKHVVENPGHRAKEGLYDPGSCDDCSERSPIWNLSVPPEPTKPACGQTYRDRNGDLDTCSFPAGHEGSCW